VDGDGGHQGWHGQPGAAIGPHLPAHARVEPARPARPLVAPGRHTAFLAVRLPAHRALLRGRGRGDGGRLGVSGPAGRQVRRHDGAEAEIGLSRTPDDDEPDGRRVAGRQEGVPEAGGEVRGGEVGQRHPRRRVPHRPASGVRPSDRLAHGVEPALSPLQREQARRLHRRPGGSLRQRHVRQRGIRRSQQETRAARGRRDRHTERSTLRLPVPSETGRSRVQAAVHDPGAARQRALRHGVPVRREEQRHALRGQEVREEIGAVGAVQGGWAPAGDRGADGRQSSQHAVPQGHVRREGRRVPRVGAGAGGG
ncbi:hypothetical protein LTR60_007835, partial [Cryomyces antarcticus]